jgi:hypothetical protein
MNNEQKKSEVAIKIQNLKESGLLNEFLNSSRNVEDKELVATLEFINNTDEVLEKIKTSENGDEELAVINAIFNGADFDEFSESFSKVNPEKAEELKIYFNTNLNSNSNIQTSVSRGVVSSSNKIKILYATDKDYARAAYADDLEWSTIGWYTGFCAATIAGFYLASYGGFWSRIAGTVAAAAGTASMVTQLIKWNNCSDLGKFISSFLNNNSKEATKILNSEMGTKILTISSETAATVALCCATPFGRRIVKTVVYYINLIMGKIIAILPPGINYKINGIPIKLI